MDFGRVELYARDLGWLNSAPDPEYKPPKNRSRNEMFDRHEVYRVAQNLPDISGCEYLVQWMIEVGLYKQSGFGLVPIDWIDLKAWAEMTGTKFTAEEALALMSASRAYCAEYSKGSNPISPKPSDPDTGREATKSVLISNQIVAAKHKQDEEKAAKK